MSWLLERPWQVLREGQAQLEQIVRSRAREAAAANDHPSVLRFVRLFKPLRLQQEGMEVLLGYLRALISDRAKADHDALVDSAALAGRQASKRGSPWRLGAAAWEVSCGMSASVCL